MSKKSAHVLLSDLRQRGLISQTTGDDALAEHLGQNPVTLYCGFDPTADSLHIGSLVPLLALKRFQMAGHKPLALVGGATGLIGDPSFKAEERQLNTPEVVERWVERIGHQISRFIDFGSGEQAAEVVNNLDWTADRDILSFLRDIGKHFSVNQMIAKESVKQRLEREGSGISFTEFAYQILQSYDFQQLNERYGCSLQIGGSDQWGNITGGVELTRRMNGVQVHGLTLPLITKADGTKFGKTEAGTIWLDSERTSPYAFYQFWISTADADVYRFLRYFTFLDLEEIETIEREDAAASGRPQAQGILAREVTLLVHGQQGLQAAERITRALFSGDTTSLSESDYEQLALDGLPCLEIASKDLTETPLTQLLVEAGLAKTGKQVKDALQRASVYINERSVGMSDDWRSSESFFHPDQGAYDKYFLVRMGKKKHVLLKHALPVEVVSIR